MKKYPEGSAHGRFQPLHKGHLEYLLKAKRRCDFLWVGVTQPDIESLGLSPRDPHRQDPQNNPMTYEERREMIIKALLDEGLKRDEFDIIPFPIESPEELHMHLPINVPIFTTICDEWNKFKIELLRAEGYKVIVLFSRKRKIFDGIKIRHLISIGDESWKEQVPHATIEIVQKYDVCSRLRKLGSGSEQARS